MGRLFAPWPLSLSATVRSGPHVATTLGGTGATVVEVVAADWGRRADPLAECAVSPRPSRNPGHPPRPRLTGWLLA
jgi:hypothetical protein